MATTTGLTVEVNGPKEEVSYLFDTACQPSKTFFFGSIPTDREEYIAALDRFSKSSFWKLADSKKQPPMIDNTSSRQANRIRVWARDKDHYNKLIEAIPSAHRALHCAD